MNRQRVKDKVAALPHLFKFAGNELKENFDKHGQEILGSSTGLVGVIVKLFAKDAIDKYFDANLEKKLTDNGAINLLKSSFEQVVQSINYIKDKLPSADTKDLLEHHLSVMLFSYEKNFLEQKIAQLESSYDIHYLHSYPSIAFARDIAEEILRNLELNNDTIDDFVKHFNRNIREKVLENFTEVEFKKLAEKIDTNRLEKTELEFLQDMERLGRIGFKSNENLVYMDTFGGWKKVSDYRSNENIDNLDYKEIKDKENNLKLVEDLIEEYFNKYKPEQNIKKVLFILSDFGKGKSTFLKHYASKLAEIYLRRGESEYFPIYFNLKNFNDKNYDPNHSYGILASFLAVEYGIKIDSDYFKSKKFIFLIDSLDESGELDKRSIDGVLSSIKKIQKLDEVKCRNNRIIVTSRPIDDVLQSHLAEYEPYRIEDNDYFISLYGFKSSQLNLWMKITLQSLEFDINSLNGFAKETCEKINNDEDIYEFILNKNLLKASELQRPIFSYMMHKLILSNIDFSAIEKIGIYLSFLNILTKDAKHASDINYTVNLADEFNFRNILHYISVLWLKQREVSNTSTLSRSDICRTIKGKIPDNEKRDNCSEINDLKFLSHSYFGNEGDKLYFNHQSFAEMLLAEYYLKVFIKFALDSSPNALEEARILLSIGTPTEQTMIFFKELLTLFKESTNDKDLNIRKKREMLLKFLVSCSVEENNRVQCIKLYNKWYEDHEKDFKVKRDKSNDLLESWPITDTVIEKIIALSKEILEADNTISFSKVRKETSVYDNEVVVFQRNLSATVPDIDKWISLVVGNVLKNKIVEDDEQSLFFNKDIDQSVFLNLIRNWNLHKDDSAPEWCKKLFVGISFENFRIDNLNVRQLNFSYSAFENIRMSSSNFYSVKFHYCSFNEADFSFSNMYGVSFRNLKYINNLDLYRTNLVNGIMLSSEILSLLGQRGYQEVEFTDNIIVEGRSLGKVYNTTLRGIFKFGIENELFDKDILLRCFKFVDKEAKAEYNTFIASLFK